MNVYDFDNTIFDGDSTFHFYLFSIKKHKKVLLYLPTLFIYWFRFYILHKGSKTKFKEKMYSFLKECDIDNDLNEFWKIKINRIKEWYLNQKEDTDIIISASPEFLLSPVAKKLNVNLIASKVNKNTGKAEGENCYYDEKVNRLYKEFPNVKIDKFYSDSYSDSPLAKISNEAFIVNKNNIKKWDFNHKIRYRI